VDVPADVDRAAPIVVRHEIEIDAPLERVWKLHTQVNRWPEWQQAITSARIEGDFEPGSSFDWSSYDFPVTSTIYAVDEGSRVLWGGSSGGVTGIHEWLFELSAEPS
jgi:uncharacterized membrane protein